MRRFGISVLACIDLMFSSAFRHVLALIVLTGLHRSWLNLCFSRSLGVVGCARIELSLAHRPGLL